MKFKSLLIVLAAATTVLAPAQVTSHTQHVSPKPKAAQHSSMTMMDMKKCMANMAAGQAKMDALVLKMNEAEASDRPEATAAVVAEMANQQKAMGQMCSMMMKHMAPMAMGSKGSSMPMMNMETHMANMVAAQARMDDLVSAMNSAEGTNKADATTAVVAEMALQHKSMHQMCSMMMKHMASHPMAPKKPMAKTTSKRPAAKKPMNHKAHRGG
ncbi:MAG: hypothetical protein HZC36_11970 [Armatimonadetes bacterium]|nr:hypothetical protein [Armatimonadota bacterium]